MILLWWPAAWQQPRTEVFYSVKMLLSFGIILILRISLDSTCPVDILVPGILWDTLVHCGTYWEGNGLQRVRRQRLVYDWRISYLTRRELFTTSCKISACLQALLWGDDDDEASDTMRRVVIVNEDISQRHCYVPENDPPNPVGGRPIPMREMKFVYMVNDVGFCCGIRWDL